MITIPTIILTVLGLIFGGIFFSIIGHAIGNAITSVITIGAIFLGLRFIIWPVVKNYLPSPKRDQ